MQGASKTWSTQYRSVVRLNINPYIEDIQDGVSVPAREIAKHLRKGDTVQFKVEEVHIPAIKNYFKIDLILDQMPHFTLVVDEGNNIIEIVP